MRSLPVIDGRQLEGVLVVRTDYSQEDTWQVVSDELMRPRGNDWQYESVVYVVSDPVWTGATPGEVQAAVAVSDDDEINVIFLTDATTMREPHHALLAVKMDGDEEGDAEWVALGLPFRTEPRAVHDIHDNLSIGNMDFEEFAQAAREDPGGVLRPSWD
jgi:hypothetical protein